MFMAQIKIVLLRELQKLETPIFNDPQNLDFTIRANMPQDIGVNRETPEKF